MDVQGGGDSQAATLDSLSKKLSDDLRQHIKSLGSYALLSKEWLTTVRGQRAAKICAHTAKRVLETLHTLMSVCACPDALYVTDQLSPVPPGRLILCAISPRSL